MKILSNCFLLLFTCLIVERHANAQVVALHQGATDPESRGWTRFRDFVGVNTFPVIDDQGLGFDAWAVDDDTLAESPGGLYGVALSPTQVANASTTGWILTARLRVVDVVPITAATGDCAVHVGFRYGTKSFSMFFGQEEDGSPLVGLFGPPMQAVVDLDDLDSGYHLYQLRFDPVLATADLFVDGILRFSGFSGGTIIDPPEPNTVFFGTTFNFGTGHGNYNLVKLEITPRVSIRLSEVEICWPSASNALYQVQYQSGLTTNTWTDLGSPVSGNGTTNCVRDPIAVGQPQRYYRIVALP